MQVSKVKDQVIADNLINISKQNVNIWPRSWLKKGLKSPSCLNSRIWMHSFIWPWSNFVWNFFICMFVKNWGENEHVFSNCNRTTGSLYTNLVFVISENNRSNLLLKARTSSLEINDRMYRFKESMDRFCRKCNMGVEELSNHLM